MASVYRKMAVSQFSDVRYTSPLLNQEVAVGVGGTLGVGVYVGRLVGILVGVGVFVGGIGV